MYVALLLITITAIFGSAPVSNETQVHLKLSCFAFNIHRELGQGVTLFFHVV
jgi:hypothetical protein